MCYQAATFEEERYRLHSCIPRAGTGERTGGAEQGVRPALTGAVLCLPDLPGRQAFDGTPHPGAKESGRKELLDSGEAADHSLGWSLPTISEVAYDEAVSYR